MVYDYERMPYEDGPSVPMSIVASEVVVRQFIDDEPSNELHFRAEVAVVDGELKTVREERVSPFGIVLEEIQV